MSKEVFEKCVRCHGKLIYKISETVIHGYPERQLVVKNVPRLECQKCGFMMQAEPDQIEKTDVFMDFLKSISLRKAEIEYRDMIDYVDKVLTPHIDD